MVMIQSANSIHSHPIFNLKKSEVFRRYSLQAQNLKFIRPHYAVLVRLTQIY